jgi:hypothetical protein
MVFGEQAYKPYTHIHRHAGGERLCVGCIAKGKVTQLKVSRAARAPSNKGKRKSEWVRPWRYRHWKRTTVLAVDTFEGTAKQSGSGSPVLVVCRRCMYSAVLKHKGLAYAIISIAVP